jgi:hypothetical protein
MKELLSNDREKLERSNDEEAQKQKGSASSHSSFELGH